MSHMKPQGSKCQRSQQSLQQLLSICGANDSILGNLEQELEWDLSAASTTQYHCWGCMQCLLDAA